MPGLIGQLGVKDESVVGTKVVVDVFHDLTGESMKLDVVVLMPKGIRSSSIARGVPRSAHMVSYKKGAAGTVTFEVLTKTTTFFLKHLLGTVVTTGPVTSTYTHTATQGTLTGDSFTMQIGIPRTDDTMETKTYAGCKIVAWTLSCDVDGALMLDLEIDAIDEDTVTSVAAATFAAGTEMLTFVGGQMKIAAAAIDVKTASFKWTNGLHTDRRFQRLNVLKKEQVQSSGPGGEGNLLAEFESLTAYNRYVAGTHAAVELLWRGPTVIGGSLYPEWKVTIPDAVFTGETPNLTGPEMVMQPLSFSVGFDGTNPPVTIAVQSAVATP